MSSKKNASVDERFRRVQKDPRFWEMPERESKVKIDKRFQAMFHDKRFQVKQTVDKRGRPVNHTSKEDLKRFYNLSDSESDDSDEGDQKRSEGKAKVEGSVLDEENADEGQSSEDEDEDESDLGGDGGEGEEEGESHVDSEEEDSEPDLARGVGNVETSSDEDGDEEEDEVEAILRREEEEIEHDWGDLCKDALRRDEVSSRLAVCNMDWDRMKAKDLLALFNSFKPKGGVVLSVKIFPSEFGKERLQQEQSQGPLELMSLPDDPEKDTEEEKVHREKLRDYQFKRLKYFYAVVECDSTQTASKLYEECDGFEYESSCSILDLRFIPDNLTFDEEPKDVATEVELSSYTPKLFTSSATATSKVEVTWDETDHERVTALNRNFNKAELLDMDFKAYLASSSEEEADVPEEEPWEVGGGMESEGEEERRGERTAGEQTEELPVEEERKRKKKKKSSGDQISRYRELLKGIHEKECQEKADQAMEMEVSWVPGLRETTEKLVQQKVDRRDQRTPWEEFLEKKREKKKQRKSKEHPQGATEPNTGGADDDDDDLPPGVDLNDPYFAEELGFAGAALSKKPTKQKQRKEEVVTVVQEEERREAEMALLMDEDDGQHQHFNFERIVELHNLSKKKKKKLQKKSQEDLEEDHFQVDVEDPRFQAMFTSHLYNLDPSDPSYRKTRGTESIVAEKQRRRNQEETHRRNQEAPPRRQETAEDPAKKALDPSLSLLVKSIKSKTEQFQARKKPKLI